MRKWNERAVGDDLVEDELMFRGAVEEDSWQVCHCQNLVSGMEKGIDVCLVYARCAVDMGVVDEYRRGTKEGVRELRRSLALVKGQGWGNTPTPIFRSHFYTTSSRPDKHVFYDIHVYHPSIWGMWASTYAPKLSESRNKDRWPKLRSRFPRLFQILRR